MNTLKIAFACALLAACSKPNPAPEQPQQTPQVERVTPPPVVQPVKPQEEHIIKIMSPEERAIAMRKAEEEDAARNARKLDLIAVGTRGFDGYRFEGSQFLVPNFDFKVKVVTYPSMAALRASVTDPAAIWWYAYSTTPNLTNDYTCTIHVVDTRKLYLPEIIGHELTHCINGNFHPSQKKPFQ